MILHPMLGKPKMDSFLSNRIALDVDGHADDEDEDEDEADDK